jgi:3-isopropylmalate dehydrogenase
LLKLRKHLGAFANLRPVVAIPALLSASTLRKEVVEGVDILIVRELTGGAYFGEKEEGENRASDLSVYTREEVERVSRVAFDAARRRKRRVTSVDKANVMATSRLWRKVVTEVAKATPTSSSTTCSWTRRRCTCEGTQAVRRDAHGEPLRGHTLRRGGDAPGSMGMLPSASSGTPAPPASSSPCTAPRPTSQGQGKANPYAAILSAAMMFRHS